MDHEVVLRPYTSVDYDDVVRLVIQLQEYERTIEENRVPGEQIGKRYIDELVKKANEQSGTMIVATIEGAVVGYVCVIIEEEDDEYLTTLRRYAYITDIVVNETSRRLGIGARLMHAAEDYARKSGLSDITVNVLAANDPARRTYEKAGFTPYEVMYKKPL